MVFSSFTFLFLFFPLLLIVYFFPVVSKAVYTEWDLTCVQPNFL